MLVKGGSEGLQHGHQLMIAGHWLMLWAIMMLWEGPWGVGRVGMGMDGDAGGGGGGGGGGGCSRASTDTDNSGGHQLMPGGHQMMQAILGYQNHQILLSGRRTLLKQTISFGSGQSGTLTVRMSEGVRELIASICHFGPDSFLSTHHNREFCNHFEISQVPLSYYCQGDGQF